MFKMSGANTIHTIILTEFVTLFFILFSKAYNRYQPGK